MGGLSRAPAPARHARPCQGSRRIRRNRPARATWPDGASSLRRSRASPSPSLPIRRPLIGDLLGPLLRGRARVRRRPLPDGPGPTDVGRHRHGFETRTAGALLGHRPFLFVGPTKLGAARSARSPGERPAPLSWRRQPQARLTSSHRPDAAHRWSGRPFAEPRRSRRGRGSRPRGSLPDRAPRARSSAPRPCARPGGS